MIQLKLILEEILKETGDFKNVEIYPFHGNKFQTEEGWNVELEFRKYSQRELELLDLDKEFKEGEVYNIIYYVGDKEDQYDKSNWKKLIKLLKTVSEMIFEFIRKNSQIKAITIIAANKDKNKYFEESDPQKTKVYKAILTHQLPKISWAFRNLSLKDKKGFEGFLIYKNV